MKKTRLAAAAAAGLLLLSGCSRAGEEARNVRPGAFPVPVYDPDEEKYGFRGETEEWTVEPQFDMADDFSENGLARVKTDGKWGYIRPDGSFAIAPEFDYADNFAENKTACVAVGCQPDGMGGLTGGEWGFIGENGSYLIEPQFDWAYSFGEDGRARVKLNGTYGYIGPEGDFSPDP